MVQYARDQKITRGEKPTFTILEEGLFSGRGPLSSSHIKGSNAENHPHPPTPKASGPARHFSNVVETFTFSVRKLGPSDLSGIRALVAGSSQPPIAAAGALLCGV